MATLTLWRLLPPARRPVPGKVAHIVIGAITLCDTDTREKLGQTIGEVVDLEAAHALAAAHGARVCSNCATARHAHENGNPGFRWLR